MFQDQIYLDYLRQLTQARELMLNELMIKRAAGDDDGALSVLDAACRRTVGVPLDLVRRTSPERLLDLIHRGGQSNFNSILIAELLLQDVELSEKIGNIRQAIVSRFQAFCLLVDSIALLGQEEQTEYRKKLDVLAADLESKSDDPYLRNKVDAYLSKKASG
ncbi:MAG: hypothetical protein LV480_05085 [Methylacidiphilales bacterium]|nr:hypothetical protein [Candidatus Methylacidiphilales bacterium]